MRKGLSQHLVLGRASHFICSETAELCKRRVGLGLVWFYPLGITTVPNPSKFKGETCRCQMSSLEHRPLVRSANIDCMPSGFAQRSVGWGGGDSQGAPLFTDVTDWLALDQL